MSRRNEYDYDNAEEGMQEAVERAGGGDVFGVLAEEDDGDQAPTGVSGLPPEPAMELEPYAPSSPSPVQTSAPDLRSQRLAAVREATRLVDSPLDAGPSDGDIAAAQGRDREQRGRDAFTEAIQAWLQRRPQRFQNPSESNDLVKRRELAESSALKQRGQKLTAQQMLVKSLADPKGAGGGLTPYQQEQLKRRDADDAYRADRNKSLDERHGIEHKEAGERADRAHADSVRLTESNQALSRAQFSALERDRTDRQAADLAEKLGDPVAFQEKYARLMALKEANGGEIPGLGVVEGVRQQPGVVGGVVRAVSPPSPQAIEGRKLVRQLAAEYARAISGAGVSNQERAQLNAATLDVENGDSSIAQAGLDTLKDMYESKVAITKAGARPEAVQRIENAPRPAQRPVPKPRPAGVPADAVEKNGKWYQELPDGSGWDEIEVR